MQEAEGGKNLKDKDCFCSANRLSSEVWVPSSQEKHKLGPLTLASFNLD